MTSSSLNDSASAQCRAYMDGIYLDNVWYEPDANGDWNRDGVTDSFQDPTIVNGYRAGNADFAKEMHRLGKLVVGNNGNWPLASTATDPATDPWAIRPLYKQYNGGVDEAVLGASWSCEAWAGFTVAMQHYQTLMEQVEDPKLEIFNQEGLTANGSDPYDSTPYRAMRYGICWALTNDGYYGGETAASHIGPLMVRRSGSTNMTPAALGRAILASRREIGAARFRPRHAGTMDLWVYGLVNSKAESRL
jgi:hypothetical protein